MPSVFQSARLTYRAYRPSDFEEFYEAWNDPAVQESGSPNPVKPFSVEGTKANFQTYSDTWALFLLAVDTETDNLVGWVGLQWARPRDGELGMLVKPSQWSKGYGTEMCTWVVQHAFNFLDAHRVSLSVHELNPRAIDLYKRVYVDRRSALRVLRVLMSYPEDS